MKKIIATQKAPKAIGPYSQGITAGNMVFTSGQIPLDPFSGAIPEGIALQTERVLENLGEVLTAGGSCKEKVIKTTVYLKNMNDFAAMNEIYSNFFGENFPARTCVEVSRLPKDVLVEIEAIGLI